MSLAVRNAALFVGRRPSRRLAWIITAVLLLLGSGTAAYAFWASTTSSSNAAAAADALTPGSKPAVSANGAALSVTWASGTTVNGRAATGYTVARYPAATGGAATPATGGCAGTVTTLTCTEQNVPGGTWYYTVTPAIALWTGAESPRSNGISSDATPPTAAATVSPTPNSAGWNSTSPVTVTVTADDGTNGSGVASITYAVDGGAQQTVSGAVATIPVAGDGTHTVPYFATDKVGNAGTAQSQTVKIDTQAPAVTGLSAPQYVNLATVSGVTVSGTAEANAKITLTAADAGSAHTTPAATPTADSTGKWTATLNLSSLNEGPVTFSATATDAAGNTGPARTATSSKDISAPAAPTALKVPTYVNAATAPSINVSGNAEAGATVSVSAMSPGSPAAVTGTAIASNGAWSLNLDLRSLKDDTVTYTVTVIDSAGNTSSPVSASNIKDTAAPVLSIAAPMYVNLSSNIAAVPVSGTTEGGMMVNVTVRNNSLSQSVTKQVTPAGTSWSTTMDLTMVGDGTLTYTASATDAAGNTGSATAAGFTGKDTVLPSVVDVTGQNGTGSTSGSLDKGDVITVVFSEAMDPAKFCAGWSGTELSGSATVADAGNNDTISFTAGNCVVPSGTLSLGANYVGNSSAVFSATGNGNGNGNTPSTLTLDPTGKTLTIKLGSYRSNSGNVSMPATQGVPSYSTATGLADVAGNPLPSGVSTSGKVKTTF